MDNTNKVLEDKPQPSQTNPSGGSVGLAQKEQAPISFGVASEESPRIDQEQKEAGVEGISETPTLTEEHKVVGKDHAGESMPVDTQLSGFAQFPMTEGEAKEHLKTTKPNDSIFGLAMVVIREIHKRLYELRGFRHSGK